MGLLEPGVLEEGAGLGGSRVGALQLGDPILEGLDARVVRVTLLGGGLAHALLRSLPILEPLLPQLLQPPLKLPNKGRHLLLMLPILHPIQLAGPGLRLLEPAVALKTGLRMFLLEFGQLPPQADDVLLLGE